MFGEIGATLRGIIVSYDTLAYYERLTLLYRAGLLDPHIRDIVEIGGGYGGLAYYVCRALPNSAYHIIDLPESLLFSAIYLPIALGLKLEDRSIMDNGILRVGRASFVPNFVAGAFLRGTGRIDLSINTLSMAEMSEGQVREYCAMIKPALGSHGAFFEQNQDNRHIGLLEVTSIIRDYFTECRVIEGHAGQGTPHVWRNPGVLA
jgi:putative sugar O-methyltransferase